jgi:hypothetical protein
MSPRGRTRPRKSDSGPGVAEAVSWQLADEATQTLAHKTLEALNTREIVEKLATRYANSDNAQRAGHLFEVMHALSFNQEAIGQHSAVRALVTEWAPGGSQTSASDIDLMQGHELVGEAQAKLYDSVPATAHQVALDHYDGMQRLVAADRYDAVQSLLDRKVTLHPDGINTEHFQDAHANVTDVLGHGDVTSDPVTYDDAQHAALNPMGWIDDEAREVAAEKFLLGVGTASGAGAVLSALANAAGSAAKVRAREMSAVEAAITACAAAGRTAARSGSAVGLGEGVEFAALSGHLVEGLGGGTLPIAMGRAAVGIAEAGFAFAKGDINSEEFAARTAKTAATTSIVWAFSSIGQTVIPIPVVGALAGAFVGQLVGTQCVKGLQMALVAARQDHADQERLRELEDQLLIATALTEELSALTVHIGGERNAYVAHVVMPKFDTARRALMLEADDEVLARFARIVSTFGGEPLFTTMGEFDAWMKDDAVFVLDGNIRK